MLNFQENPTYELEGISTNKSDEKLAEMILLYNPVTTDHYSIHFNSINYNLIKNNLENKLVLSNDILSFLDKAYEMI